MKNQDFINSKDLVQISIQTNQNTNDIKQNSREISELNSKMNTLATKEDLKKVMDMLTKNILDDFRNDYPNIDLKLKIAGKKYHDRYIAIDYGTDSEAFFL